MAELIWLQFAGLVMQIFSNEISLRYGEFFSHVSNYNNWMSNALTSYSFMTTQPRQTFFVYLGGHPKMTSRNYGQFLKPPPPSSVFTRFITKALVMLSQNPPLPKTLTSFMDDPLFQLRPFVVDKTTYYQRYQLQHYEFCSDSKHIYTLSRLLLKCIEIRMIIAK